MRILHKGKGIISTSSMSKIVVYYKHIFYFFQCSVSELLDFQSAPNVFKMLTFYNLHISAEIYNIVFG